MSKAVRLLNWDVTLSDEQKQYSAMDAAAGLDIYRRLIDVTSGERCKVGDAVVLRSRDATCIVAEGELVRMGEPDTCQTCSDANAWCASHGSMCQVKITQVHVDGYHLPHQANPDHVGHWNGAETLGTLSASNQHHPFVRRWPTNALRKRSPFDSAYENRSPGDDNADEHGTDNDDAGAGAVDDNEIGFEIGLDVNLTDNGISAEEVHITTETAPEWTSIRVKLDAIHAMFRVVRSLPKRHSLHGAFCSAFRDAMFGLNPDSVTRLKEALMDNRDWSVEEVTTR